jgi:phosphomannomutase
MAVRGEDADAGIILTASHNPKQWNALKLLNAKGEFISADQGAEVLRLAGSEAFRFSPAEELGSVRLDDTWTKKHIAAVLGLDLVDVDAIRARKFRVVVDAVNSVGGTVIPALLRPWAWLKRSSCIAIPRETSRTTRSRCRSI